MDQAQGAEGTVEAEQTTQTTQEPKTEVLSPLQAAVRKEMGIEPATHKATQAEEPEEKPEEQPEPEQEDLPSEVSTEEGEPEPAAAPAAAEAEEQHLPENWPTTAKARVAEEARKRRERTAERDQWKAEAERANAQLQQAQAQFNARQLGKPSQVGEVLDQDSLEAERYWTQIRGFTRENPDGADDVFLGKDAQGEEERHDYSRNEIIKMGMDADQALSALSAKRALLQQARDERVKARVEEAKQVYPDLFKDTPAGREAAGIVQRAPWIMQSEEWALDVGDYIAGRKMRLAKAGKSGSKATLSPGAQAILGAPKMAPAPGVIKSRSASGGPGPVRGGGGERVDEQKANEEFYAKGMTSEALEDKIRRKLAASQGGRTGGKQAALV